MSYICIILQRICQKHLLIIRVSQNPLILLIMRLIEWRYQLKPFNSHFQRRERSTAAPKDNAPSKRPRIPKTISSKSVNPSQPQVGRHPKWMSIQDPDQNPPGSTVHPNSDPGTLEHPDSIWEMTRSAKGLTFSHAILISRTESII